MSPPSVIASEVDLYPAACGFAGHGPGIARADLAPAVARLRASRAAEQAAGRAAAHGGGKNAAAAAHEAGRVAGYKWAAEAAGWGELMGLTNLALQVSLAEAGRAGCACRQAGELDALYARAAGDAPDARRPDYRQGFMAGVAELLAQVRPHV